MPATPEAFVHRTPAAKVVFRPGALEDLAKELALLGVRRPMLLASCASRSCRSRRCRALRRPPR
jgi:hypothetical protein